MDNTNWPDYSNTLIYKMKVAVLINDNFVFILGMFLNILVVKICSKIKMPEFQEYKRLLMLVACSDIFFTLTIGAVMNMMEPGKKHLVIWPIGPIRYLPEPFILLLSLSHMFLFMFTVSNNFIVFMFRYLIIVKNKRLSTSNFAAIICLSILWNVIGYVTWLIDINKTTPDQYALITNSMAPEYFYAVDGKRLPCYIINPFRVTGAVVILYSSLTVSIVFVGVVFSIIGIKRKLHDLRHIMSEKSKKLETQLNLCLIINAFSPLFISFTPILFLFTSVLFEIDLHGYGHLLFLILVWVDICNPIVAIVMVGPCFEEFCNIFRITYFKKKQVVVSPTSIFPSSNI
uniref:G_PROTEIN_RECEP_F1_2 domain-containing protein n=1 Tax=Rhabditophanes sp. KR3021 TaxID=114890 RepID=A0AC35UBT0_9BILA